MISRKPRKKCTPQLCGNWSLRVSLNMLEREENHLKAAALRKSTAESRKAKLEGFSHEILSIFEGTSAHDELKELDSQWRSFKYNKEVCQAAIMVKNVLGCHPDIPKRKILIYNMRLKAMCDSLGILNFETYAV